MSNQNKRRNKKFRNKGKPKRVKYSGLSKGELIYYKQVRHINSEQTWISTVPKLFCPKSVQLRFCFPDGTAKRNNSASKIINWSLRSSAYDPDPNFSTGAVPGFNEWSNFYFSYRVHNIGLRVQFSNPESFAQVFGIWPYEGTLIAGNSLSWAQGQDYLNNPRSRKLVVPSSSGGSLPKTLVRHFSLTQIIGNESWLYDPDYVSLVTGNPNQMVFLLFVSYAMDNTSVYTSAGGLNVDCSFYLDVELFERKPLTG